VKRGTVVWIDLSDAQPPELGKVRPGIVVSGTVHNEVLDTVVVVPTSSVAPEIRPLRLAVGSIAGRSSFAVVPGIRQVRKSRLKGRLGELDAGKLAELDECLEAYLR
jgi:mRNA-degrading endonuclease toxin of MazEF toxin-antitoxin module